MKWRHIVVREDSKSLSRTHDIILVNRDVLKKEHPEALRAYLPEIQEFADHNHTVLNNILTCVRFSCQIAQFFT